MAQCTNCGEELHKWALKCAICGQATPRKEKIVQEVGGGLKEVNGELEKMFSKMLPAGEKFEADFKKGLKEITSEITSKEKFELFLKKIKDAIAHIVKRRT